MSVRPRAIRRLALAFCTVAISHTALAQPAPKPAMPSLSLPEKARGEAAIRALAGRLPAVAAAHGKSAAEFTAILRRDRSAWVDKKGRLFFVEEAPVPTVTAAAAAATTVVSAVYPLTDTFRLHSKPGAKRTIYLDFNGHVATGTAWNASYGITTINAPAFDIDGNPAAFSDTELTRIQNIWRRVAEDYAPFDVDVTTEEPLADAITRSTSTDDVFGTRVVITRDWVPGGCGCGGFAYLGVFDAIGDYNKPAWVFYDRLGPGNEKYVAEAVSHEAGHNMGLAHDGTSTTGYYQGHGSGATGWAPIMGVGYYRELVQWSRGEYPDANNREDDFAVMLSNGLPIRADDHGDTPETASNFTESASGASISVSAYGLISHPNDVDVFRFNSGAGALNLTLGPTPLSPNLDLMAELRDAAGNVLATSNPIDTLGASISINIGTPGTYYLHVQNTGKGDLATGYSDYGSLGWYIVSGSVPASSGGLAPIAVIASTATSGPAPLAVQFDASQSYDPDGAALAAYQWSFGDGTSATGARVTHTYASGGSFNATLTVTDATGLTGTKSIQITATAPTAPMWVNGITMTVRNQRNGTDATATVTVMKTDPATGATVPVVGATVSGQWSGVVQGSALGTTGTNGSIAIKSPRTKAKTGTFTFTVSGVALEPNRYESTRNVETSDSISF